MPSDNDRSPPEIPDSKPSRDGDNKSHSRGSRARSSNSKTSDDSKTKDKQKLRLTEAHESEIRSPGATAVKQGTTSQRRSNKIPDSQDKGKQKLRLAEADGSQVRSPGAIAVTEGSSRSSDRRSKKEPNKRSSKTTPVSSKSKKLNDKVRLAEGSESEIPSPPQLNPEEAIEKEEMPQLEAIRAPDYEEMIETAREQGRQQGIAEGRGERSSNERDGAPENATSGGENKKKRFIAAFVFAIVVAAGITAWQLLDRRDSSSLVGRSNSSQPSEDTSSPSEEDCLAVSLGIVPTSHNQTKPIVFGVEIDFAVPSGVNMDVFQTQLELKMQQNVLPVLMGCAPADKSIAMKSNINFIAVILNNLSASNPAPCNEGPGEFCSTVYFQMDLFAKTDNMSKEALVDIIRDLYQDEGLLALLDLVTPVEGIYFTSAVEILPSSPPSPNPTSNGDYPSQSPTFAPVTYLITEAPTILPTTPALNPPTKAPTRIPIAPVTYPITEAPTSTPMEPVTSPTTKAPTMTPIAPVISPTSKAPTRTPTIKPTLSPSSRPTTQPSRSPTLRPTPIPTPGPTRPPTPGPTRPPTAFPTPEPTLSPTPLPTMQPSAAPSKPCIRTNDDLQGFVANWDTECGDCSNQKVLIENRYGPIGDWCFGPAVTSMASLFSGLRRFNEDISRWDVSGITDMSYMFENAERFNQDISMWDVSSVTNMGFMFVKATAFNQDIGRWNVSSVTNMRKMLESTSFNHDLCVWGEQLQDSVDVNDMFSNTPCPDGRDDPDLDAAPPGPFCHSCA